MTRRGLLARAGGAAAAAVSHRLAGSPASAGTVGEAAWCSLDGAAESFVSIDAPSAATAGDPAVIGAWSRPTRVRSAVIGVHAVLVRTGKVLLVEGRRACVWDPVAGTARGVDPPEDLFCAGHCVLGDGRVFFAGGAKVGPPPTWTMLFDPVTETWGRGPTMRQGRWYPTTTTLPDGGHVVITTGDVDRTDVVNEDVEVFSAADTSLTLVGSRRLGLYPHQAVMPDGRVLVAGPAPYDTAVLDPADWSWAPLPRMRRSHHDGGAVLLPAGPAGSTEILLYGNGFATGATVESFDLARPEDGWRRRTPLPQRRAHMNAVLLPDGTVLGVGGANRSGNLHRSLHFDPAADTWTPVAAQAAVRAYHSTALLLPDGRVLSAGDNIDPGGMELLETYSPPYLFRGPRPTIGHAPENVAWGTTFEVATLDAVARVVLLRPGSVTHTNDMEQRHVELAFSAGEGVLQVAAPPSGNVAPAGWYLLFLLDGGGVPSTGAWVRVGA